MNIFNLKIKTRLILMLSIASVMLVIGGIMGVGGIHQSNNALKEIYDNQLTPTGQLSQIYQKQLESRYLLLDAAKRHIGGAARQAIKQVENNNQLIDSLWAAYMGTQKSDKEKELADSYDQQRKHYRDAMGQVIDSLKDGDFARAETLVDMSLTPAFAPLDSTNQSLINQQLNSAETNYSAAVDRYNLVFWLAVIGVAVGILLLAGIGAMLIRSIGGSLREAIEVARKISRGELDNRIVIKSRDETGDLLLALREMDERLTEIVAGVRESAEAVGAASGEIAEGNDDLSQRTQEQASSLEETASSMEEMTSTVKQNADNARQANQLAAGAREQAEKGGEVVRRAVSAMGEINASSTKISDIISVIDEIAFQTNLLALNAAVEAARAGEQGRGFAVVASEVRNLAQRSASAAKEIKDLINDSVGKVKAGTELVDESGNTLEGIVESVKKVTDIVAEIAAASHEQSAGIEQVNNAVMQMDEVTQQNAALVEEAAAASRTMQQQTHNMMSRLKFFKTGDSDIHVPYQAPAPESRPERPEPREVPEAAPRPAPRGNGAANGASRVPSRPAADDNSNVWQEF